MPPERNRLPWSAAEPCPDCHSAVTASLSSRWPGKGGRRRRKRAQITEGMYKTKSEFRKEKERSVLMVVLGSYIIYYKE